MPPRKEPATSRTRSLLFAAALAVTLFAAYQPAWQGGLLWDDAAHLTRPELRSWHGLWRIWFDLGATQQYYPVTHTAFWLEHRLWGDATLGYHLVNIALHLIAALFVAAVLRRLRVPGAWLAAAAFALHPVHVESVAWLTELKNTLSACFYLAAAAAYLRFRDRNDRRWYALALSLFVLALGSKTVTATLPAALLVIVWWQQGRISWRRDVVPLVPFFVLGAAAGFLTAWVERRFIHAEGADFDFSIVERVLIAGHALWFYAAKLFWPANLSFIYERWHIDQGNWALYLYPLAAIGAMGVAWAWRRRSRGPMAAALFFIATLAPALGFVNVYPFVFSFVADHFQYLASLGLLTLAAAGLSISSKRSANALSTGELCGVVMLAALGFLTWKQSHDYADVETLYRATLARNPECWMAYNNLGGLLITRGATDEGRALVLKAVGLRPGYAEAHNNLGIAAFNKGRFDEAATEFRSAIETRPAYADAESNLGLALASTGEIDEALLHQQRAFELDPQSAAINFNYGTALMLRGRSHEATERLTRALAIEPTHAAALNSLGMIAADAGNQEAARRYFEQAIALNAAFSDAHTNLGIVLARMGRLDEAIRQLTQALKLSPTDERVRKHLGSTLAARQRSQASIHEDGSTVK